MTNNDSLGRGLESLIPPQKKPQQDDAQKPVAAPPDLSAEALAKAEDHLLPSLIDEAHELPPPAVIPDSPSAGGRDPGGRKLDSGLRRNDRSTKREDAIFYIETSKIKPNEHQPRKYFDAESIQELASSIREFGLLQPIVVTKKEKEVPHGTEVEYELIAGERRLMAAKNLGMERIPAIIRHVDLERERLEIAIIENLQREDLNPLEVARAMARLQDEFRLTQREIAARLGKSRETVANTVRLLDLPTYIQNAIEKNQISESHGLFLLGVEDPGEQQVLFQQLIEQKLTTRELRERARALKRKHMPEIAPTPEIKMFEEKLSSELGAPVSIQQKGDSGKITIDFFSKEELENIVHRFTEETDI